MSFSNQGFKKTNRNLLVLFGNTHAVVDQVGIVTEQRIATILGDNSQRDQNCQTITVTLRPHKVEVAAVLLVLHLHTDSLLDLPIFELDGGIILVSVSVVVGQYIQGFLVALFGDEPTGRFGDP